MFADIFFHICQACLCSVSPKISYMTGWFQWRYHLKKIHGIVHQKATGDSMWYQWIDLQRR